MRPVSILRIPQISWHWHGPPTCLSMSLFRGSHHGMLSAPFRTSGLNSEMILFPRTPWTISQTQSGPSNSDIFDRMHLLRISGISDSVFSATRMYHPLQVISVRQRLFTKVHMHYYWSGLPVYIKEYCKLCTICSHTKPVRHRLTDFSSKLLIPESLEFYFDGFNRKSLSLPVTPRF